MILLPLTVEIQRAALAVGELAAHLLDAHRALSEVLHALEAGQREGKVEEKSGCNFKIKWAKAASVW